MFGLFNDFAVLHEGGHSRPEKRIALIRLVRSLLAWTVILFILGLLLTPRIEKFDVVGSAVEVTPSVVADDSDLAPQPSSLKLSGVTDLFVANIAMASESKALYGDRVPLALLEQERLEKVEPHTMSVVYEKKMAKHNEVRWAVKQRNAEKEMVERKDVKKQIVTEKTTSGKSMIVWNNVPGTRYSVYGSSSQGGYVRLNSEPFEGGIYYHHTDNSDMDYIVMEITGNGDEKNIIGVKYNYILK